LKIFRGHRVETYLEHEADYDAVAEQAERRTGHDDHRVPIRKKRLGMEKHLERRENVGLINGKKKQNGGGVEKIPAP